MPNSVLSASAQGATFLILFQVGSRLLTFGANQVLLRYLSPELLGVSAQLELYSISVLFFARESLRVALQRQTSGAQTVVNLAYIAVLLGVPLTYGLAAFYLQAEIPQVPYFIESLKIYGVAALIELLSEPAFAVVQQQLLYKVRASAETVATIGKCLATCGTAIWASRNGRDLGVLPFAMGQFVFAVSILAVYVLRLQSVTGNKAPLLPRKLSTSEDEAPLLGYFSRSLTFLSFNLFLQSTLKYVLTQGDAILITALASLSDQGAYALASNYGGLIARMLFQPIEESSRNLFAKLCADSSPSSTISASPTPFKPPTKPKSRSKNLNAPTPPNPTPSDPASEPTTQASLTLRTLLKAYLLLTLLTTTLGPPAAPPLLRLLAGPLLATPFTISVLQTYCLYIPFLALNGVSEAFVAAVATPAQLRFQSAFFLAFFLVFGGASYVFLGVYDLGARGLVYANCVNMGCRTVFNLGFVQRYFRERGLVFRLLSLLPSAMGILVSAALPRVIDWAEGTTLWREMERYGVVGELARVGALGVVYVGLLAYSERKFLAECLEMVWIRVRKTGKIEEKEL